MFGLSVLEIANLLSWALLAVGFLLFLWLVLGIFLFSARQAGIENRTYGKAFLALMICFLIPIDSSFLSGISPSAGIVVFFLAGAAVTAWVFSVSFGKGIATEILFIFYCFCSLFVVGSLFVVFAVFERVSLWI